MKRVLVTLCAGLCSLALAAQAGATGDPLFIFTPVPPPPPRQILPPPTGYLNGPCGLTVDSSARFYVSDYYHHAIDLYSGRALDYTGPEVDGASGYEGQLAGEDPLDGPCGLALNSIGRLFVNNYHRNVVGFDAFPSFGVGSVFPLPSEDTTHHLPTGVAVDTSTDRVYVDHRTYVSIFDSAGNPVEESGKPVLVGKGSLDDGYGVAVSQYPGTAGYLYVPDAATNTVKVYDPAGATAPVAEIKDPFDKPFASLRDSAIAVDRVTGDVYFTDNLQPEATERPQASIYVYSAANSYKGRLKYNVIDALPAGLAVDNSALSSQGRVYVTSGNTSLASVYAYPPGSAALATPLPPLGSGLPAPGSSASDQAARAASAAPSAGEGMMAHVKGVPQASGSSVSQKENLRVSLNGRLSPKKLPREGVAPIGVQVGWDISTSDGSVLPKLESLQIEINRHGLLDHAGLPSCPYPKIQPASTKRALSGCRPSLVGRGTFTAEIALRGQEESYETTGQLLLFKGEKKRKTVLYGQIYSSHPFATSFVIPFAIKTKPKGTYGTVLAATLPKALRSWGNLTGIEMKLQRTYSYKGASHSFLSAGCPAPKGFRQASFDLARASFAFAGGKELSSTVSSTCKASG